MFIIDTSFGIHASSINMTSKQASQISVESATQNETFSGPLPNTSEVAPFSANMKDTDSTRQITIPLSLEKKDWTVEDEKRFRQLVKNDTLNDITSDDKLELEYLMSVRRSVHHPRTSEEIIHEYKQRLITENLIRAMDLYVEFSKPAS